MRCVSQGGVEGGEKERKGENMAGEGLMCTRHAFCCFDRACGNDRLATVLEMNV